MAKEKSLLERLKEGLTNHGIDREELLAEVWLEASRLYRKYDFPEWRTAVREFFNIVAQKIAEGEWDSVYRRLYKLDKEEQK